MTLSSRYAVAYLYFGPMGVALVLIYPCGKARIGGADAPETGTSLVPRIQ